MVMFLEPSKAVAVPVTPSPKEIFLAVPNLAALPVVFKSRAEHAIGLPSEK
jgi:hypothetical protein